MYGMINAGVKSFVISQWGEEAWQVISKAARVPDHFDIKASYSDETTFNIVFAIAQHYRIDPRTVLEMCGEHWITYALEKDYGVIFKMYARDFRSSLQTLNQMHKRMSTLMPSMLPPVFKVLSESDQEMRLLYTSIRKGLGPLAIGLIRGLGKYYQQSIEVSQISDPEEERIARADTKNKEVAVFQILLK